VDVILVRHPEVALRWKSRCYGCSDMGLSRAGHQQAHELAMQLAREPVAALFCSGLKRARALSDRIGALADLQPRIDARWRERDFAAWEGRTWNAIWRETGNAMDGMLASPNDFRPGGGETTAELAERALTAFHALPFQTLTVVVTHGGPIAAVRAAFAGAPLTDIAKFVIPVGCAVRIARAG
jgi:alpha-ribazole phosphatase